MKHGALNKTMKLGVNLQNENRKANVFRTPELRQWWSTSMILRVLSTSNLFYKVKLLIENTLNMCYIACGQELFVLDLNIQRENNCFYGTMTHRLTQPRNMFKIKFIWFLINSKLKVSRHNLVNNKLTYNKIAPKLQLHARQLK